MTHAKSDTRIKPTESFVNTLAALDRGDIATLRRNAGRTVAQSRGALPIFYRIVPHQIVSSYYEEIYFLVATLFGHNKFDFTGNFGETMAFVRKQSNSDNVDRRMSILLDSEFEGIGPTIHGGGEMAYRLRQCVKLAHSKGVGVNWVKLIDDLCWWSHPLKIVRKQWARAYFAGEIQVPDDSSE